MHDPRAKSLKKELRKLGHDDLANAVDTIPGAVATWWNRHSLWTFTDHGPKHSRRVADYAMQLVEIAPLSKELRLNPIEQFVLWASAWVHDLGMQKFAQHESEAHVRTTHPERTRSIIQDRRIQLGTQDAQMLSLVAAVANAHGTHYYQAIVDEVGTRRVLRDKPVRVGLLAALLLLGDEFDLNTERALPDDAATEFDSETAAHWLKHQCVSHAALEHTADGVRITVQMHFPASIKPLDRAAIEHWIGDKLRRQIALVDAEIAEGFNGMYKFDPNVVFTRSEHQMAQKYATSGVMAVIRRENIKSALINHSTAFAGTLQTVADGGSVVLAGGGTAQSRVNDGRSDLYAAVLAHLSTSASLTASVWPPLSNAKITASDVLRAWVTELYQLDDLPDVDEHEDQRRERLLGKLVARARDGKERIVLGLPGLEQLQRGEVDWLVRVVLEPLAGDTVSFVLGSTHDRVPAFEGERWHTVTVGKTSDAALKHWVVAHLGRVNPQAGLWSSYAQAKHTTYRIESERVASS
ncbi:hypothetical protein [Curtobacterium poinsettiae]|uniref:HD domain-containing protein n=1 Tax=Curtobacterium poinsettiae TaxID=159612 RepID=UPI0021C6EA78|nr:hypothetical protein [Curtobacterium flaccumfaciens]MCU0113490.1 hypothetical protein [Curtobacterium flaccumfaciens]